MLIAPQTAAPQTPVVPQNIDDEGDLLNEVAVHSSEYHNEGTPILENENTYVTIAFLLLIALGLFVGVPKILSKMLGARGEEVRRQLDEARTVREEAQRLLADYQKRQREAETEAEGIIEQAKKDAKAMSTSARAKLDDQLARRRAAAEDRIARAEAQAIAEVRGRTAELAIAASREIIANEIGEQKRNALLDQAISKVGSRLN